MKARRLRHLLQTLGEHGAECEMRQAWDVHEDQHKYLSGAMPCEAFTERTHDRCGSL